MELVNVALDPGSLPVCVTTLAVEVADLLLQVLYVGELFLKRWGGHLVDVGVERSEFCTGK